MLDDVPEAWGPKLEYEGVAVSRTHTGPNTIHFTAPAHLALVMFTPQPGRKLSLDSDRRVTGMAPVGSLEIVPAQSELFAGWVREKQNLLLAVDPYRLTQLAAAEFDNDAFEFRPPKMGTIDRKALDLARYMRWEVENQELGWRECLDSLTTAFSIHLLRHYSSLGDRQERIYSGGLRPAVLRKIDDLITGHLRDTLTLDRLASVAGLSPSHFARAFKQSTGMSPHQYIIEARLVRARHLIINTGTPLKMVARLSGFSSNSHLTSTMRRAWNTTPTLLGLEK